MRHKKSPDQVELFAINSIEQLTAKQVSIVRLLATGATQGMISRQMRISRASVSQTCLLLEENNLIKKEIGTRYNILYSVSPILLKRIGGDTEPTCICRVHSIAMKFQILKQDKPFSTKEKTGWQKTWKMRGWYPNTYWFQGKVGEISCSVTTTPKSIIIRMDPKQKIIAKDEMEATHKGYQHLVYVRQRFIDSQRLFGVDVEIEPTGRVHGKAHYGYPMPENHPAVREIREGKVPGWTEDDSLKKKRAQGVIEGETEIQAQATIMGQVLNLPKTLPDMIKNVINPIGADITAVKAMMMGEVTMQRQYEQMMKFMTAAMTEIQELRKEVQQLKSQP